MLFLKCFIVVMFLICFDSVQNFFYLCKNEKEENEMKDYGYALYPLDELPQIFYNSCELRFIDWANLTPIVEQGENKVVFTFNTEEKVVQF